MGRTEPMGQGGDKDPFTVFRPGVPEPHTAFAFPRERLRGRETMPAGWFGPAGKAARGSLALQLWEAARQAGVRRTS